MIRDMQPRSNDAEVFNLTPLIRSYSTSLQLYTDIAHTFHCSDVIKPRSPDMLIAFQTGEEVMNLKLHRYPSNRTIR